MTNNQQRAGMVVRSMNPEHAYVDEFVYDGDVQPLIEAVVAALDKAEARGRAEGYRAAVEESRQFCARSGGCIS